MFRSLAFLLLLCLALPAPAAHAAESTTVGAACSGNLNRVDWDAVFQCVSSVWKRAALWIGASSDTCDSSHAGQIQWTGTAFLGCDGSNWNSLGGTTGCGAGGPSSFSFTDQTGIALSTTVTSNAVTLSGNSTVPWAAVCGTGCTGILKNGTSVGTSGVFNSGDTIAITQTSSSSGSTATTAALSVGATTAGTWTVTTANITKTGSGTSADPWIVNSGAMTSCYALKNTTSQTTDGVYQVTLSSGKNNVYCDMTKDGGGWTLAVGIQGATHDHLNTAAVTPTNLTSTSGYGKFSDADINGLKSSTSPAFRLYCSSTTGYWQTGCTFASTTVASDTCVAMASTYGGTYVGTTAQTNIIGLADGNQGTAERLIYGDSYGPAPGCDTAATSWGQSGTLWIR